MATEALPFDGDDDTLLDAAHECLCDNLGWSSAANLPPVGSCARVVGDVLDADFCICEAGLHVLIRSDSVFDLTSIVDSYVAIGAMHAAACIQSAFDTVPDAVIAGPPAVRRQYLPEPDTFDPIGYAGHLSFAYCEHANAVRRQLVEYIRAHRVELSAFLAHCGR